MTGAPPTAAVAAVVSLGGALGALARWGVGLFAPTPHGAFPLATFAINVVGCALLGALVVAAQRPGTSPLARPFLGTGVLGGFTTFSAYAVDTDGLASAGVAGTAVLYAVGTLVVAVIAAWVGMRTARAVLR